ncbi:MAG: nitroreductase family protein [Bacillota bacterium]
MEVVQAISDRRSIRKFEEKSVNRELIEQVLDAAIKAPSGKNRQPWRFFVLQGAKKDELIGIMERRVAAAKESGWNTGSAENSARIMRQAPVLVLVFDPNWTPDEQGGTMAKVANLVDIQSIGAAIQNMLLAALDLGLGSLWICDILYAAGETAEFVGLKGGLVAAVALGYPAESPAPRSRKSRAEVATWMG